ncbi:MAG TPA: glycosyltransferase [Burkholderiaceae bacterium]|nr:glycosyltransferase [Burkholderiaceae bacterium]
MARANGHLARLDEDYARAAERGIRTVRESVGWRLSETAPHCFDVERPLRMARSARRHGVQILWTLMHYGTPADVDLRDDAMIDRFAAFAAELARALADETDEPPIYTLINEINFLSWAVAQTRLIGPYRGSADDLPSSRESGYEIKRRLVRATLAATEAVRRVDPRAHFMQVEPLVHVVAPAGRDDLVPLAAQVADYQWQAWDLLAGRAEPELGGSPETLGLLGINHYHSGQWEVETERRLQWHERDPRRRGLDELLEHAWRRYGRPMLLAETSHVGAGRALWLSDVASQIERARERGVPVCGICLYPLVDRPDWNDAARWHHSGLWDVVPPDRGDGTMQRLLNRPYAQTLERWQRRLPNTQQRPASRPLLLVLSQFRWDLVLHRVHHLMSQLCADHRIVYVEEPVYGPGEPCFVRRCPMPGVEVLQPQTPCSEAGFGGLQVPLLRDLIRAELGPATLGQARAWSTTPTASPLLAALQLRPWVHDFADGGFETQPTVEPETAPTCEPRLVLASGPALARVLGDGRKNLVYVHHAVDREHFAPTSLQAHGSEAQEALRLLGGIEGPRFVYTGTIDDRLDLALLAHLTEARPDWQIVLVGPMRLSAGRPLPASLTLHWLGSQPYSLLPCLLGACEVALLPYACGPGTATTHPPQLLEYLAAAKPVVCTPLPDVVELYAGVVEIAADSGSFVQACERALARADAQDPGRAARVDALLTRCSWAAAADQVRTAMLEAEQAAGSPAALLECHQ